MNVNTNKDISVVFLAENMYILYSKTKKGTSPFFYE